MMASLFLTFFLVGLLIGIRPPVVSTVVTLLSNFSVTGFSGLAFLPTPLSSSLGLRGPGLGLYSQILPVAGSLLHPEFKNFKVPGFSRPLAMELLVSI